MLKVLLIVMNISTHPVTFHLPVLVVDAHAAVPMTEEDWRLAAGDVIFGAGSTWARYVDAKDCDRIGKSIAGGDPAISYSCK